MASIFISHSSKDKAWTRKVQTWLESKPRSHRSLFLDFDHKQGLKAGDLWEQQLYGKLRQCQVVLGLVSRDYCRLGRRRVGGGPWKWPEGDDGRSRRRDLPADILSGTCIA